MVRVQRLVVPPDCEYSHERMAKKSTPMRRTVLARRSDMLAWSRLFLQTTVGSAFWCFVGGSFFLYPQTCCAKESLSQPAGVFEGLPQPLSLRTAQMWSAASRAVSPLTPF
eukprot:3132908-Ditylum_brightwellii.AAC.1